MTTNTDQPLRRATREDLQYLHTMMVHIFMGWMKMPEKLKPYHLSVLRQFLKDNNVAKNLTQGRDIKAALEDLKDTDIPFIPLDLPTMPQ